jgi:predicted enzyme related to lactoylglutathione lyase
MFFPAALPRATLRTVRKRYGGIGAMTESAFRHGTSGWNELVTTDTGAARNFFGKLLGWTFEDMPMPDGQGAYVVASAGGQRAAGMFQMSGENFKGVPPHWMGYITVTDVDAAAAKVSTLGGKVCIPPTDIPKVGRFCIISDPTGATVSLMQWSTEMGN